MSDLPFVDLSGLDPALAGAVDLGKIADTPEEPPQEPLRLMTNLELQSLVMGIVGALGVQDERLAELISWLAGRFRDELEELEVAKAAAIDDQGDWTWFGGDA